MASRFVATFIVASLSLRRSVERTNGLFITAHIVM
jgi:hypothetical protein